jgi:hypothetical protein
VKRRFAAALLAVAFALAGHAWAADPEPTDAVALEAQKEQWQSRFRAARAAVAEARERQRAARDAYAKMRHRGKQRGDAKRQILAELSASETALEDAQSALEEMFETARRAGVPPGWMRMPHGENPAAPEPSPAGAGAQP